MQRRGLRQSQVAAYTGVGESTVSKWVKGATRPDPESCLKLAELFHEPLAKVYALAGHPAEYTPEERAHLSVREAAAEFLADLPVEIPVHEQTASAGFGQDVIEWVYWEAARAAGRNIVGLRVRGSSMEPDIRDGDTIFIDRNLAPEPGRLVVASVGDQVFVKRYEQRAAGALLRGNNGSAIDAAGAKIEGVVIQLSRDV